MTTSVVIATRNRPSPLEVTLKTLMGQTAPPTDVLVVDSSDTTDTEDVVALFARDATFPIRYLKSAVRSAAVQRNLGIDASSGDLVVFMDDDVELEQAFLEELVRPFHDDVKGQVGGVSGTIVNQVYTAPRGANRWLLGIIIGERSYNWAGRIIGPAVNFLPRDIPDTVQRVEWLNTTGTAYRRSVLHKYRFSYSFSGYSFAEDVHLSCRVGKEFLLLNTTRARYLHHDMGQRTHTDWVSLGQSSVINRYEILTDILGRCRPSTRLRFFLYEVFYGSLAAIFSSRLNPTRLKQLAAMMLGKLKGFWSVWLRSGVRSHG